MGTLYAIYAENRGSIKIIAFIHPPCCIAWLRLFIFCIMSEEPTLETKQRTGNSRYHDQKPSWFGMVNKSTFPKMLKPLENILILLISSDEKMLRIYSVS